MITVRFLLPCLLLLALPAIVSAQSCCQIRKDKGQAAYDKGDYQTAIYQWEKGTQCPEAEKCPDLARLLAKAKAKIAPTFVNTNPAKKETPEKKPPPAPDNFIRISGGTFQMGDLFDEGNSNEKPVRDVALSDFYLSPYEVTNEEFVLFLNAVSTNITLDERGDVVSLNGNVIYDNFCGYEKGDCDTFFEMIEYNKGNQPGGVFSIVKGYEKYPVVRVSWYGTISYSNWMSEQAGLQKVYEINGVSISANWNANGYRLPTEAEWEYAARQGGKKVRFGNGKDMADPKTINFNGGKDYKLPYSIAGEYRGKTVPVGSLNSPNALGLHDMSGNLWEWCWDWDANYTSTAEINPKGPDNGSYRVGRGGAWDNNPSDIRCSCRYSDIPDGRGYNMGFRLARAVR